MFAKSRILGIGLAAIGVLARGPDRADAGLVYTLNAPSNGINASATFSYTRDAQGTPIGIAVAVTNNSTIFDSAHAISGVILTINPATIGVPTALATIAGEKIVYAKNGGNTYTSTRSGPLSYTPARSDPDLHWYLNSSSSKDFSLNNVGYPHVAEMIIAKDAKVGSNVTNFNPYFNGTAVFGLTLARLPAGLTTADITGVTFQFGTSPEYTGAATGSGATHPDPSPTVASPEPRTVLPCALAGLVGVGLAWLRRRSARPDAAPQGYQ